MNYPDLDASVLENYKNKCEKPEGEESWKELVKGLEAKIIVLDDDPTGTQTVHDIPVFTRWDGPAFEEVFACEDRLVFVLTNSRSLNPDETEKLHTEIAENISAAAKKSGKDFIIISRSDSTLRGHFPLETETLRRVTEAALGIKYDGEIICPFFPEGGRYTLENVHYVRQGERLVPAAKTEFARDKQFPYSHSELREYCEEKTGGAYPKDSVKVITNKMLMDGDVKAAAEILLSAENFEKIIINAATNTDIRCLSAAIAAAVKDGKRFMIRSAAAIPKCLGGVSEQPYLRGKEITGDSGLGGMVIAGSHVNKTSVQLKNLEESGKCGLVLEFNQHLVLDKEAMDAEIERVRIAAESAMLEGKNVLIYTRREKLELPEGSPLSGLALSLAISDALTRVVSGLRVKPGFLVAKGGITSSDVCTKGLGVTKATVMGQPMPGVPVWRCGEGSKFPGMPYIIFPGNVGSEFALCELMDIINC